MTPVTAETLFESFGKHPYSLSRTEAQRLASAIAKANSHDNVDAALALADTLLGGFGVESIQPPEEHVNNYYYNVRLLYVNQGDAYAPTIAYDTKYHKFGITTWGGWVEWAEAAGEIQRPED